MWDKRMPHTHKRVFYPKLFSLFDKLFFDVGNILIIFQRESEKTRYKPNFELKLVQLVIYRIFNLTLCQIFSYGFETCQILKWQKYNASDFLKKFYKAPDFELKILKRVSVWI